MNRLTPELIRKYNPTITALPITLILVDERKLRFKATAVVFAQNIADPVNGAPESQTVEVASPDGKVRTWPLCCAPHNGHYVYCRIMCTDVFRGRKYGVAASVAGR